MDIVKYRKNKELEISNDDFDIEKLEKDARKGYVLSSEVDEARQEAMKEATSKYVELESKYNDLEKSYNDLQEKNVAMNGEKNGLKLQVEMMDLGFPRDKFEEVSKLRSSPNAFASSFSSAYNSGLFGTRYFANVFLLALRFRV